MAVSRGGTRIVGVVVLAELRARFPGSLPEGQADRRVILPPLGEAAAEAIGAVLVVEAILAAVEPEAAGRSDGTTIRGIHR